MANLGGNFDATQAPARQDFTPIPDNRYRLMIVESQVKAKKGTTAEPGTPDFRGYAELEADVQDGPHQGRKLFIRLNLWSDSEQAVSIASAELGELCKAVGKLNVTDTTELHGILFDADVVIKAGKPYPDPENPGQMKPGNPQNVLRKYHPKGSGSVGVSGGVGPSGPGAGQTTTNAKPPAPWAKKA